MSQHRPVTERKGTADEESFQPLHHREIRLSAWAYQIFGFVDYVVGTGESLMGPGVCIDVSGDSQAMQRIGRGLRQDGIADHLLRHRTRPGAQISLLTKDPGGSWPAG